MADYAVQIPMVSRQINCLNVAAAAAVGLYYLTRGKGRTLQVRSHPEKKRPDLLLLGAGDQIELGSSIRSACAFGWERALVEDRFGVWFGCDRATRSEGRGAARRGRNPIRLIPTNPSTRYPYQRVSVVTVQPKGTPLQEADLALGAGHLIVIPDESRLEVEGEDWERFGVRPRFIHLDLPTSRFVYHYRMMATIAMAEVARQVGQKARKPGGDRGARRPIYESALRASTETEGEVVFLEELACY